MLRHREVRVVDPSTRAPVPAGCLACGVVQVVAAPDARLGEVAAAFIRLLPGATTTERTLINHCLGRIATFKVPRYIRFVTDWPMSGTKVQKFRLRELVAEELRSAGITEAPRLSSRPAGWA
ncbi:hypothetical protein AB0K15_21020 [Amycolatopsis sp. NPDC049253]|uniref:AMP-binding enzyme n=1 Tax=Amycolatopsis sp. NPDC049253 TaxID=3155274 RepID=UPI0034228A05